MSNKIKGFKAMEPDMTCRHYKFQVGGTFKHNGPVVPCESGFHFCQRIDDICGYYGPECRIFEVEASGVVVDHFDKTVTDTLKIVREIDYSDYIKHQTNWVRAVVACQGIGLDILVRDPDWRVRLEVAYQGYGLDILVNDIDWHVRTVVGNKLQDLKDEK